MRGGPPKKSEGCERKTQETTSYASHVLSPEMAPAPSVIQITGKVKGAPKIKTEGKNLVIKKTLHDNAVVEERHTRKRVTGKKKDNQLIPAADVARAIDSERAESKKKVEAINNLANEHTKKLTHELEVVRQTSAGYADYIANHINHPPPAARRRRRRRRVNPEASPSMQFDGEEEVDIYADL